MTTRLSRTHINVVLLGGSQTGKTTFVRAFAEALGSVPTKPAAEYSTVASAATSDAIGAFQLDPKAWSTTLAPVAVPEANRELVYNLQVRLLENPNMFLN